MEGASVVGRQNAYIADTVQLREVAMATTFGLAVSGLQLQLYDS